MGGHLLGSTISRLKDLEEVDTVLFKGLDLVVQGLDLSKVRGLSQTLCGRLLSSSQPGVELLDSGSVLSPVFDIVGVLVALNLGVSLELLDVVCDPLQLILESLSISRDLVSLGQELKLILSILSKDLQLGGDVLLEVHGPGNSVLRKHGTRGLLDVLELSSGSILPGIKSLEGVVEGGEGSNKLLNLSNSSLESAENLELLLNSLDLLGKPLLLVLRDCDAHGIVVIVDGREEAIDGVICLLHVSIGSIKVEDLLNLLDLLLSSLEVSGNGLAVLSIANEGSLGLIEELQSVLGLLLGVLPPVLDSLDIGLKELGFVGVLEDDLTLGDEVCDNVPLGVQLGEGLLLSLNELINILKTRGGDVSGGGEHDSVQELHMGLELITIGVTLPVEIHHDRGLLNIW